MVYDEIISQKRMLFKRYKIIYKFKNRPDHGAIFDVLIRSFC